MDDGEANEAGWRPILGFLGRLVVYGVPIALVAAIAIPNIIEARCGGCETAAIGGLKTIGTAQDRFKLGDYEKDGNFDYGSLAELAHSTTGPHGGLVDSILGSGTKTNYLFETTYSRTTSEFLWFATASPNMPGVHGDRYFCTDHEGLVFWTSSAPIPLNDTDCAIPKGAMQVGRY